MTVFGGRDVLKAWAAAIEQLADFVDGPDCAVRCGVAVAAAERARSLMVQPSPDCVAGKHGACSG